MMYPSLPYPRRRYVRVSVFVLWLLLIALVIWWSHRAFSLVTYLGWLLLGGAVIVGGVYTYRVWSLERLRYSLDRDGVYVRWGEAIFVFPMRYAKSVYYGPPPGSPSPSRWMWPASYVWLGEHEGKQWYIFASVPWEQGVFLCGDKVCLGITPADGREFLRAINARRSLGVNRPLALGWRLPRIARWRVWQDSVALSGWIAGIILLVLLWGEAAIRLNLPRILWMARLGSFILLVDWVLGMVVYPRERLAGVILWWGGSFILALLLIGLWVMRI